MRTHKFNIRLSSLCYGCHRRTASPFPFLPLMSKFIAMKTLSAPAKINEQNTKRREEKPQRARKRHREKANMPEITSFSHTGAL